MTGVVVGLSPDPADCACPRCSAIVRDTTTGRAMAPNVAKTWRLVAFENDPDVVTKFFSCSCRIDSSASSSVTLGSSERRMSSATLESVVGPLHASQAAPAVAFKAKTVSFLGRQ